jgi:hypothetical protein
VSGSLGASGKRVLRCLFLSAARWHVGAGEYRKRGRPPATLNPATADCGGMVIKAHIVVSVHVLGSRCYRCQGRSMPENTQFCQPAVAATPA